MNRLLPLAFAALAACSALPELRVKPAADFELDGTGRADAWSAVEWTPLVARQPDVSSHLTRVKMLYSKSGLYVLFDGADRKLSAKMEHDNLHLWEEDVFEAFFWTDEGLPLYFEYEISPHGKELPILVPNWNGRIRGWLPWDYEGGRRIRKAAAVRGGPRTAGAAIEGWSAEVFIPYELLTPLGNVPPTPGMRWRGNFYRMDYDTGTRAQWAWAPVGPSFHEFRSFGILRFE
jgi:hypothetical protein